eukprot:CAMPEP_0178985756 /NCGR_PEP_ID=MMETSP0795-20121207/2324_1 /TAXON_ID=88552 /ORGANISM="Amoebophrya sp., Strain Ameob2" /LENGTH=363 /DNA_ID=CAMNT_0020676739 /DNA_START=15 /DNA_END=1108 /DNA_ORIENTATION=+
MDGFFGQAGDNSGQLNFENLALNPAQTVAQNGLKAVPKIVDQVVQHALDNNEVNQNVINAQLGQLSQQLARPVHHRNHPEAAAARLRRHVPVRALVAARDGAKRGGVHRRGEPFHRNAGGVFAERVEQDHGRPDVAFHGRVPPEVEVLAVRPWEDAQARRGRADVGREKDGGCEVRREGVAVRALRDARPGRPFAAAGAARNGGKELVRVPGALLRAAAGVHLLQLLAEPQAVLSAELGRTGGVANFDMADWVTGNNAFERLKQKQSKFNIHVKGFSSCPPDVLRRPPLSPRYQKPDFFAPLLVDLDRRLGVSHVRGEPAGELGLADGLAPRIPRLHAWRCPENSGAYPKRDQMRISRAFVPV